MPGPDVHKRSPARVACCDAPPLQVLGFTAPATHPHLFPAETQDKVSGEHMQLYSLLIDWAGCNASSL